MTLCNTKATSSARRLRRLKMTPQLCHHGLVSQTSSFFVDFGVFFSVWSVSSVFPLLLTADLRGASCALLVATSTQQLLLRACTSWEIDRMRSRDCSSTAVGERAVDFRLGSRVCSRVCWWPLKLEPTFTPLLQRAHIRHRVRCLGDCRSGRG